MSKYTRLIIIITCISSCFTNKKKYNFTDDVAPIVFENCTPCHHKNGAAPFAIQSYHDVVKRAKMITYVTESGYMPPWPADTKYSHFIGEKVLTENEKKIIREWYLQGSIAGDTSHLMRPIVKDEVDRVIGKPDTVLHLSKPFFIPGDNKDRFMVAKIPFELPVDTNIRLIEFVVDNKRIVHHVNVHLLTYDKHKPNHLDPVSSINSEYHTDSSAFYLLNIPYSNGDFPKLTPSVSNYLPGVEPIVYPDGIGGVRATKQSAIMVKDFHFGPSPIDEWDNSYFNIYYCEDKPKRPLRELIVGTQGVSDVVPPLVIPPNEIKSFSSEYILPETISVLTINPHMHLIGKEYKAYAVVPDGDTIPLIKIDNWNFRWQYFYTFPKMVILPKGSQLKVEAIYDNTSNNMDNPFNPPQFIIGRNGSMKTTDEMLQLIVTYLPYQQGDEFISLENHE